MNTLRHTNTESLRTMGPFPSEFKNELHEVDTKIIGGGPGGISRHNRLEVNQSKMTRSASIVSLVPANNVAGGKHTKYIYKTEGRSILQHFVNITIPKKICFTRKYVLCTLL